MTLSRRGLLGAGAALALARPAFAAWDKGDAVALPPLTLLDGKALDMASLRSKVVVLEFWASWCPFCAKQLPLIETLYRQQKTRGLEVVGVSIDRTRKAAQEYYEAKHYSFPAGMLTPQYDAIFRLRRGLPQTYVIGRDGRVLLAEMGEMFEEDVRALARFL